MILVLELKSKGTTMYGEHGIIQVAGALDSAEVKMLVENGVTHVGLPLGPGVRCQDMSLERAAVMVREMSGKTSGEMAGGAEFVLITYLADPQDVLALCRRVGAAAVQLHGRVRPEQVAALKGLAPELFIIKSLVVGENEDMGVVAEARAHEPYADAFLTDTYDPSCGARGATGKVHDWGVDAAVVGAVARPVILAGGLHPGNVAAALRATGAAGVDAHTGLENASGRKDPELVRAFVGAARSVLP